MRRPLFVPLLSTTIGIGLINLLAVFAPERAAADNPPVWYGYGGNAQHTALSTVASQPLDTIKWSTPVDLDPQYAGNGDLYIHYGSPMITAQNTIIVPVKTGATDGFQIEGINASTGSLLWTQPTDYSLPSSSWTPSYSPTLTPSNRLYYAGAGGTIYYRDNVNAAGAVAPTQLAFYGLSNYQADPSAYANVKIDTPIVSDSAGDIYFGFVAGSNPSGLQSGIARISATGQSTWISASAAAGGASGATQVAYNAAPALSNDGSTVYVSVNNGGGGFGTGYLTALNSTTLQPISKVQVIDPKSGNSSVITDQSSASPMVAPDGHVFYGVLESPFATSKGWMQQYSGALDQTLTPGAFGWDSTPSIVPASMVPSYTGTSSYLLMTKYNNYYETGGDGLNKLAILDPNATQTDARTGATVMKEILTIVGPTPNDEEPGVREWCINSAAVDPATDSILVNSEDGYLYRWDLSDNTLSQSILLAPPTGEAYTPTVIGADGTVYAINNSTLFAVGAVPEPSTFATLAAGLGCVLVWSRRRKK